jgi:hypothetical protein|tara:strand:- start:119 stop:343 length:225 start_codon:yes stop_codon:yes gene_type:complete
MDKTENKDRGAFACVDSNYLQEGLTKREYFAAKALQGITANQPFIKNLNAEPELVAIAVLEIADKVLELLKNES